jgi:RimJ/RimL family protein N-acetyltransferase
MVAPDLSEGRLHLRLLSEYDIAGLEQAVRDPEIARWFAYRRSGRELYEKKMREWHDEKQVPLAILDEESFVGHIFLEPLPDEIALVGYWLLPEGRGHGHATRALKLVSSWAFRSLGVARLELSVTPANHRSRAVAERAGYVYEGTQRAAGVHNGQRFDKETFSLLPADLCD